MRHTTRRQFLAASGSAGGGIVCAVGGAGLFAGMGTALAADGGPSVKFPEAARERIAIASYPFRDFIARREDKSGSGKMELKEFVAHVSAKFNIKKIEPWSPHFRSLDKTYLEELRAAVAKAGGAIVNVAVDGEHSPYAMDSAERELAVASSKEWIDAAGAVGLPSVRPPIPPAEDAEAGVERTGGNFESGAGERGGKKGGVV